MAMFCILQIAIWTSFLCHLLNPRKIHGFPGIYGHINWFEKSGQQELTDPASQEFMWRRYSFLTIVCFFFQMLDKEPKLLELLSVFLDEYCSVNVNRCCGMAYMDERSISFLCSFIHDSEKLFLLLPILSRNESVDISLCLACTLWICTGAKS